MKKQKKTAKFVALVVEIHTRVFRAVPNFRWILLYLTRRRVKGKHVWNSNFEGNKQKLIKWGFFPHRTWGTAEAAVGWLYFQHYPARNGTDFYREYDPMVGIGTAAVLALFFFTITINGWVSLISHVYIPTVVLADASGVPYESIKCTSSTKKSGKQKITRNRYVILFDFWVFGIWPLLKRGKHKDWIY